MNLAELKSRMESWEDIHTEFKGQLVQADNLAASLVSLANTDGGALIFGVDENRRITGIPDADQCMRFVDNVSLNNCEPPLTVLQELIQDEWGSKVIVVQVPKGDQRPYRTNRGVYYIRTASGRRQASRSELLRLFQSTESLFYDEMPITRARTNDLDDGAINSFVQDIKAQGVDVAGIPESRLLTNWNLMKSISEKMFPTLAGMLFFGRDPQQFVPHAYVSALWIDGSDISQAPEDQKHIDGRLFQVYEDVMRFLGIHLKRSHKIEGVSPEVRPELPIEVFREAIVNSLAHRDYTIAAPIRILVFRDRIEIHTPGLLPNTVTIESIKLGVHVLRNPTIYNILLKMGYVTDAGSGIPRMIRLVRQHSGREIEFAQVSNEFIMTVHRGSPNLKVNATYEHQSCQDVSGICERET